MASIGVDLGPCAVDLGPRGVDLGPCGVDFGPRGVDVAFKLCALEITYAKHGFQINCRCHLALNLVKALSSCCGWVTCRQRRR